MDLEKLSDDLVEFRLHNIPIEQLPYLKSWMDASPKNRRWVKRYMTRKRLFRNIRSILNCEIRPAAVTLPAPPKKIIFIIKLRGTVLRLLKPTVAAIVIGITGFLIFKNAYKNKSDAIAAIEAERNIPKVAPANTMVIFPTGDTILLNNNCPIRTQINGLTLASVDSTRVKLSYNGTVKKYTVGWVYIKNSYRKIMDISLPDDSQGSLNAGTTLGYYVAENGPLASARSVNLQGEAFFDVRSDPKTPFIVGTLNGLVTVTGTRFNVTAYDQEKFMQVSLLLGRLKVKKNGTEDMSINAGEQATIYANDSPTVLHQHIDSAKVLAWRSDKFDFIDKTIPEIMVQIGRWYGFTEIVYKGKIDTITKNVLGSGTMAKSSNYEYVLEDLLRGGNLQYLIKNKHTLIIYKNEESPGSISPNQSSTSKNFSFLVGK